jgi:hypothetical protein
MLSIQQRLNLFTEAIEGNAWQWACMLRVAIPGAVVSFDTDRQTCVVQPLIQEIVLKPSPGSTTFTSNIPTSETIKPIQDVIPIMMRASGWSITFPITAGAECLLIFADMCIDGWWQSGGVQAQFDRRRHDLSDAFALFGPWSQPNKIGNYSTTSLQIRSDDQGTMIELAPGVINIKANTINLNAGSINATGSSSVTISGNGATKIENRTFLMHDHSGVSTGLANTGPVV